MEQLGYWAELLANLFTITVTGIALYLFFFNKEKIKSAINFILNYSYQLTLTDLKFKIERLNSFTANDSSQKNEIVNILNEIEGQILGNKKLKDKLKDQYDKIVYFTTNPKVLTEPKKRSLVSEIKESIRTLDVSNFNSLIDPQKDIKI